MNDLTLFSTIYSCDAVAVVTTAVQTDEIKQWISLGFTIIASIATLILSICKWVKMAKKDGKIDKKEIEDLQHIIEDGVDKITDVGEKEEKDNG